MGVLTFPEIPLIEGEIVFDIRLSQEQREFRDLARKFAQEEIKPKAMQRDLVTEWEKRVPWDLLKQGSQLGFRTFVLQEENGGSGMSDHITSCLVAEELAAGELGTAYYFMLTARRARDWFELRMTPEQRAYFLPKFVSDDLYFTTVAIHEPETDFGFDFFTETPPTIKLRTQATPQPDGSWIINGTKAYQTVGYLAKLIVLRAQIPDGTVQSFLVEGDAPGLSRRPMSKFGRRVGDNAAEMVFDNVRLPLVYARPRPADPDAMARERLAQVGLGERMHHQPSQLSGGQQQRVAIARVMIGLPDLIIADEPTSALDRVSGRVVVDQLKDLAMRAKCAVVLSTHDERIFDVATRRLHIEDGRCFEVPIHYH